MSDHQPQTAAKSVKIAFALWLTLGPLGGHRFYLRRPYSAAVMLAYFCIVFVFTLITAGLGSFFMTPLGIWLAVDAFLIPRWVRALN